MLRIEAIELLNEIANIAPEILQRATQISLDPEETPNCRIIMKSFLTKEEKVTLLSIIKKRNVRLLECSPDMWTIS